MTSTSLSKDKILSVTTVENIYCHFLGVSNFLNKNISSPFTQDKNPSFRVYKNGSFKCNSSTKQGDVFQFVAYLNNIDVKTQFKEVLQIIANEMNLNQLITSNDAPLEAKKVLKSTVNTVKNSNADQKYIESVEIRDFTELDIQYWTNLGVDVTVLQKYNCNSIKSYTWFNGKPLNAKNEMVYFAWKYGEQFKIYIPKQLDMEDKLCYMPKLPTGIFGLEQLGAEKKESIIIFEGEKDAVVASSRGFNAVTFGSATMHPKKEYIETLLLQSSRVFVCYDADNAGIEGMNNIVKSYPKLIPIYLPKNENIKGFDITDYFQEHTAQDFQKIIDLAVKNNDQVQPKSENNEKQITTIIHITENYLNEHYKIRHNIIANEIEICKTDFNNWTELNENSLWIEMQKLNIKVPASTLEKILKSDFVQKFNPLIDYFENLPVWDKKIDYITQYSDYIKLAPDEDKAQYNYHFKKWCVRAVKCATDDFYFNKNAFVISDEGKGQYIGKTTWIRNLCPQVLSNYLKDDLPKDEKDAKIALTQNFIVNLDELASLSKQEINTLKSLFSADKIKVRFPYDKKEIVVRRVANFIGSTNLSNFLHDETGSVRWLCFVADKIDFSYKKEFNIDNLWSQAFALSKDENFDETITSLDMSVNELRNAKFQIQSPEKDLICRFLEIPTTTEDTKNLTTTEIQQYLSGFALSIKLNNNAIGKALTSLKYRKIRSATTTKYAVKYKDSFD